jgi:ABC-type antimicrobial peptide transport system permease subunit
MVRLAWVLGRRSFYSFFLITFLFIAILGATYIISRYALKVYTEDQLGQLPCDIAVYQSVEIPDGEKIAKNIMAIRGIKTVNHFAFFRLNPPMGMRAELDDQPLVVPWISVFASTDLSLFPPEARSAGGNKQDASLSLVGPKTEVSSNLERFKGAREFAITELLKFYSEKGDEVKLIKPTIKKLFSVPISRVFHLQHADLDKWLLEKTGSTSYIPYIGSIVFIPFDWKEILNLDYFFKTRSHIHVLEDEWLLLRGRPESRNIDFPPNLRPVRYEGLNNSLSGNLIPVHSISEASPYLPELFHLISVDRKRFISGWDLKTSRDNMASLVDRIRASLGPRGPHVFVNSSSLILLDRMLEISRLIRIVILLMALPLLWMTWIFGRNLVTLVLLRERRTVGMMRLRGMPQRFIRRVFLVVLVIGGLSGGILGLVAGSIVPLLFYEGKNVSFRLLVTVQDLFLLGVYLLVGIILALLTNRKISRFTTSISPVEAASRVSIGEAESFGARFGFFPFFVLFLGGYKILSWIFDFSLDRILVSKTGFTGYLSLADHLLDLVGLPFFIYGFGMLIVSNPAWLKRMLRIGIFMIGGKLKDFSLHHTALKPHRVAAVLLIAALATGTAISPSITTASFYDKAVRGTCVRLGADINLIFDTSQFVEGGLKGQLRDQLERLGNAILPVMKVLNETKDIKTFDLISEATVQGIYVPGYGLKGIPLYLIREPSRFLNQVYFEEPLGGNLPFSQIVKRLDHREVAVSRMVADFWGGTSGQVMQVGTSQQKMPVVAKLAGTLISLPGMPQRMLEDRESFVAAQVDYLNYLFRTDAYLVASMSNPDLYNLEVMVPRMNLLIQKNSPRDATSLLKEVLEKLPVSPARVQLLHEELGKMSKDMFITLTSEIMKVYLWGGLLISLIAIFATALANFSEDRRTFALLRLRGASPGDVIRVMAAQLYSPVLLGILIGGATGVFAGFGITNLIWGLRRVENVITVLPTRLIISATAWKIFFFMIIVFGLATLCFGIWIFRRSARESLREE